MKNTHYILIGIILSLQIVFANMAPAQKIVADRMEDGSGITVRNSTGNTIYVFQNSEDVKNLKENPRKYSGHEVNSDKLPAAIHGSEFLKCTKGNFKYIDIASGGSVTILFNIPNDPSTLFYCYEKIDGKIAKEYPIIINKPATPPVVEKKEVEPEVAPIPPLADPPPPPPTPPTPPPPPTPAQP
ncbi:MAG: hypothetical protein FWG84_06750, partial [Bacteroidales bacterium]|nr:hypothetical protein [Bacteroidales bacterium]